jgi:2-amino-4-hydroxy-6-hydroxymethyldihydropteridine diphosphokinase
MNPASQASMRLSAESAVIVALGCNDKGDWATCEECLEAVLVHLESEGLKIVSRSGWWTSKAWPDPADPPFINGVVVVETDEAAQELMRHLSAIEDRFGRKRSRPNAPRTLDLDLIAYGRIVGAFEGVILPHPRASDRLFVMGPIAQIMPDWMHPTAGLSAADLAKVARVGDDARPM